MYILWLYHVEFLINCLRKLSIDIQLIHIDRRLPKKECKCSIPKLTVIFINLNNAYPISVHRAFVVWLSFLLASF